MRRLGIVLFMLLFVPAAGHSATGGGDLKFEPKKAAPVYFSHEYHVDGRGIRCLACHIQKFEKVGERYKMKKGKLNKRDFCEVCHNGLKAFDAQSTKNCSRCHKK